MELKGIKSFKKSSNRSPLRGGEHKIFMMNDKIFNIKEKHRPLLMELKNSKSFKKSSNRSPLRGGYHQIFMMTIKKSSSEKSTGRSLWSSKTARASKNQVTGRPYGTEDIELSRCSICRIKSQRDRDCVKSQILYLLF